MGCDGCLAGVERMGAFRHKEAGSSDAPYRTCGSPTVLAFRVPVVVSILPSRCPYGSVVPTVRSSVGARRDIVNSSPARGTRDRLARRAALAPDRTPESAPAPAPGPGRTGRGASASSACSTGAGAALPVERQRDLLVLALVTNRAPRRCARAAGGASRPDRALPALPARVTCASPARPAPRPAARAAAEVPRRHAVRRPAGGRG